MKALYEKIAESRWKQMLNAGALGLNEVKRLGGGSAGQMQGRLQAPGQELVGGALERYRDLMGRLGVQKILHSGGALQNAPHGPGLMGDRVHIGPDAGTGMRMLADHNTGLGMVTGLLSKQVPESIMRRVRRPVDQSLHHAVTNHELAEQAMIRGAASGNYKMNPFASHAGPAALIAENLGGRDADATRVLAAVRGKTHDDAYVQKLLRNRGMVGNYVPPLGGRAHRSVEEAVGHMPISEGGLNRFMTESPIRGTPRQERVMDHVQTGLARLGEVLPQSLGTKATAAAQNLNTLRSTWANKPVPFQSQDPQQVRRMLATFTST